MASEESESSIARQRTRNRVAVAATSPAVKRCHARLDEDDHRPAACSAIVDRLTFAGQIIETGTTSYRLAHARRQRARAAGGV
jgi:hypothetical protein